MPGASEEIERWIGCLALGWSDDHLINFSNGHRVNSGTIWKGKYPQMPHTLTKIG